MVSRRRFLLLLGGATTGIWLASTGLVRFERRLLLTVAGSCSFCEKPGADVLGLVGTAGRSVRICDECMRLCFSILEEELPSMVPPDVLEAFRLAHDRQWAAWQREQDAAREASLRLPEAERQARIQDTLRRWEEFWEKTKREIEEEKRSPRAISCLPSPPIVMPVCSFCDRPRREVAKMISGSGVFICDSCVAEAAGAMAHLLRA